MSQSEIWSIEPGPLAQGTAAFSQPQPVEIDGGVRLWDSMVYQAEAGYRPQFLDLRVPVTAGPAPLVVWLHGGGLVFGSRRRRSPNLHRNRVIETIVESGYAVAIVDYRLLKEVRFPGAVQDVRAAVRWLRGHAERFGIDPSKVALWGESGGAQLALMTGLLPAFEDRTGEFHEQSEAVQAIIDWYAPADLTSMGGVGVVNDEVVGGAVDPLAMMAANSDGGLEGLSPLMHVTSDMPPTFIAHGSEDDLVPVKQSHLLHAALGEAGVVTEMLQVPGGHVFVGARSMPFVIAKSLEFLRREMLAGREMSLEPDTLALDARVAASKIAPIFVDADGALRSGPEARSRGVLLRERFYPPQFFDVTQVSDETIEGPNGPIRLRLQRPAEETTITVVYLHGGGWIIGDLDSHEANASRITAGLPAHLIQVDYRLAPEHPFPHGFDDAITAIRWVVDNIAQFGGDRSKLILAGDSAGGNLAAATAAELLSQGFDVRALLLIYPATDFRGMTGDMAEAYLGAGFPADLTSDPRVSPAAAPNLSSFPPTIVGVGTGDFLYQDNLAFASALNDAGAPVVMRSFAGLNHGFFSYGRVSRRADAAAAQMVEDLKDVLAD